MSTRPASPSPRRWERYTPMARHVLPAARHLVASIGPPPRSPNTGLLDIGSGIGTALEIAIELGWSPIGLDRSPDQLAASNLPGAPLVLGDGQHLPIRDDSLDAVISNFGLIFAERPESVLDETRRALIPGRRCAWSAWCPGGWPNAWRTILTGALGRTASPFPTSLGVEATARAAMTDSGFVDVDVEHRAVRWDVADARDGVATITTAAGGLRPLVAAVREAGRWSEVEAALIDDAAARLRDHDGGLVIADGYLAISGRAT